MNTPPSFENGTGGSGMMQRYCIDRHNGQVNAVFVDFSVHRIGLKELWTLKWHKEFDTAGLWTRAGGALPEDWPEWMRQFKDY
jgi:prepilin-type processing-associated H-X9-DG protein